MRLLWYLLDLLYPPKCVFCTALLTERETDICTSCRQNLVPIQNPIKRGRFFRCCHSVYHYEDHVAEAVRRFKFAGKEHYAQCFGQLMAMRLLKADAEFDFVTWAPVSKARLRKRGYDQAKLLAEVIARELGCPCLRTLKKIRNNPPQSKRKDAAARQANVIDVYRVTNQEQIAAKRLLLVDDVITSGATLSECSRLLKMAGAEEIIAASLAATREQ